MVLPSLQAHCMKLERKYTMGNLDLHAILPACDICIMPWQRGGLKRNFIILSVDGPGGDLHINLYGTCRFSRYHFSA